MTSPSQSASLAYFVHAAFARRDEAHKIPNFEHVDWEILETRLSQLCGANQPLQGDEEHDGECLL